MAETKFNTEEIMEKMTVVYSDCQSYEDHGVVKTVFHKSSGIRTVEKPFSTCFVRPDKFRFEFSEKGHKSNPCFIIWSNKSEAKTWFCEDQNKTTEEESLSMAIACGTGISSLAAYNVPALLVPEIGGNNLLMLVNMKLLTDKQFNNSCYCLQGSYGHVANNPEVTSNPVFFWVDKQTFLIRKIEREVSFSNFSTQTTTTYYPVVNQDIPEDKLEFNPPEE